jgi:hypothetical protein
MSKRVQIAVIREANLNAKPTDTHYLAEGGLRISRKDAVALKGTKLYYQEIVDLGKVTGGDFIPGRDIPVYTTDSDPVLAMQPHLLRLVDEQQEIVKKFQEFFPLDMQGISVKTDTSVLSQNAPVQPVAPTEKEVQEMVRNARPATETTPDAPVKRRPGRPRKVVAEAPITPAPALEPDMNQPVEVTEEIPAVPTHLADFEVTEKQDDESTFLIDPNSAPPAPKSKPEFSFEMDEDEAPPPPPVRSATPVNLGFEVEDDEPPAPVAVKEPEAPAPSSLQTDDFGDVEPGLFDE